MLEVLAISQLAHWWRAGSGYDASGWVDVKGGKKFTPAATMPALQTIAAYNNKPALKFTDLNNGLQCPGIFVAGQAMGWLVVGRAGDGDNAALLGTNASSTADQLRQQYGSNGLSYNQLGSQSTTMTLTANNYGQGPLMLLGTNNPAIPQTRNIVRRSTGLVSDTSPTTQTVGIAGTELRMGWGSLAIDGGDVAEVMIFNTYIGDLADVIGKITNFVVNEYGWSA
ncbi:hypothetical protein [Hydrocarboniphaga effusa]|uniref:hypothetical protein n=1 Tax=Hydrocarboniphaga effusa TaxID=243629 RepID=UPI003BA9799F